jgi:hypothetical protein
MTTVQVLPIDNSDNSDHSTDNPEKSAENDPTIPENEPAAPKKRGRPAGAVDVAKRKTPERKKKEVAAPPPPPPPPEPIIEQKKAAKKEKKAPTIPRIERSLPSEPPPSQPMMTPHQYLRELQQIHRTAQESHWSKIIGPMFH